MSTSTKSRPRTTSTKSKWGKSAAKSNRELTSVKAKVLLMPILVDEERHKLNRMSTKLHERTINQLHNQIAWKNAVDETEDTFEYLLCKLQ
jgi:hypothetical protein